MFTKPIVFIIGAGASAELGFPTGDRLKKSVASALAFSIEDNQLAGGDRELFQTLRAQYGADIQRQLDAGNAIARVANSFLSVDEVLHHFSSQPDIVALGKIVIAREILKAENKSALFDRKHSEKANLNGATPTWMNEFLSMAVGSLTKEQIGNSFSSITMINFNYDRSFEHYLYWMLRERFDFDEPNAVNLIRKIKIIRPYGSLGPLNWDRADGISYGMGDWNNFQFLERLSKTIRTYTEQNVPDKSRKDIESAIDIAKVVVFLGFGFHAPNMNILKAKTAGAPKDTFGTVVGIDNSNHDFLKRNIQNVIGHSYSSPVLVSWSAAQMLEKLRLSIMGAGN